MEWYHLYFLFLTCFLSNGTVHWYMDKYHPQKRYYKCDHSFLMKQYNRFSPTIFLNLLLVAPLTYLTVKSFGAFESQIAFTWYHFLLEQIFFAFWFETFFYFSHALFHQGLFMKYIHYQHHEMVHSIGIGAVYCHPLELIVSNYLPFALPIVLYEHFPLSFFFAVNRPHVESVVFWTMLAGTYVIFSHNGYPFPHPYPKHLVHHKNKFKNFGTLGFWDYILKTDE